MMVHSVEAHTVRRVRVSSFAMNTELGDEVSQGIDLTLCSTLHRDFNEVNAGWSEEDVHAAAKEREKVDNRILVRMISA